MKTLIALSISIATSMALSTTARADAGDPTVVDSTFHTTYIPDGFDTNDQSQFVIEGYLSSTCYKPTKPVVSVDHETKRIVVSPKALYYQGPCLPLLVTYSQVIDVGLLKLGRYTVVQGNEKFGEMNVRLATHANADDWLYAPVRQAYLKQQNGKTVLRFNGEFISDCHKLVDVQISKQDKVIVVQPITAMEPRPDCAVGFFPYEKTVEVKDIKKGRYLLHVRSLSAHAVNTLVDIK